MSASKATYICVQCNDPFEARSADRARGWARYCSKSCKAIKQEKRTGQYKAYQDREDNVNDMCYPHFGEESF